MARRSSRRGSRRSSSRGRSRSRSQSRSQSRSRSRSRSRSGRVTSSGGKTKLRFGRAISVAAVNRAASEYGAADMPAGNLPAMRPRKVPISVTVARDPAATTAGKAYVGCVEFLRQKKCYAGRNPRTVTAQALRKVASMVSGKRGALAGLNALAGGRRRRRRRRR